MMQKWKLNGEQLLFCLLGFFVGRAVCFEMNPLVLAFWIALVICDAGTIFAYLGIVLGLFSAGDFNDVGEFLVFSALLYVGKQAYHRKEKLTNEERAGGSVVRQCVLAAVTLLVTQVFYWTIFNTTLSKGLLQYKIGSIKYVMHNQHMWVLALCEALLESLLAAIVSYLFVMGFSRKEWEMMKSGASNRKLFISGAILLAIILYGLPGPMYATFAIAETVCYLAVLLTAYLYGVMESTLVAALCGAVLAYQSGDFQLLGLVTLLGLVGGLFRELGRIGVLSAVGALVVFIPMVAIGTNLNSNFVKGYVTAAIIFLFIPSRFLQRYSIEDRAVMDLLQEQMERNVREKMRDFSNGFYQLQKGLKNIPEPVIISGDSDYKAMYMQMKETVCDQCEHHNHCFYEQPETTFLAAKSVFQALEKHGCIAPENIPAEFARVCEHSKAFLLAANQSYEHAKAQYIVERKFAERRNMLAQQVGDIAQVMSDYSSELMQDCDRDERLEMLLRVKLKIRGVRIRQVLFLKHEHRPDGLYVVAQCNVGHLMTAKEFARHISSVYGRRYRPQEGCKSVVTQNYEVYSFVEAERYQVITGVRRLAFEAESNGDNFSVQQYEDGSFVAMLSDGMGTGTLAYNISATLIELLEEFLDAGFERDLALRLANSVLTFDQTNSSYATLDFLHIDLFSGIGTLVKIGAVATFIKHKDSVDLIVSTSLPVGVFSEMDYDSMELTLEDGDLVVMVSDGVMDAIIVEEKEQYLKGLLLEMDARTPQEVADGILEKIYNKNLTHMRDDMTVLACSIWKRG